MYACVRKTRKLSFLTNKCAPQRKNWYAGPPPPPPGSRYLHYLDKFKIEIKTCVCGFKKKHVSRLQDINKMHCMKTRHILFMTRKYSIHQPKSDLPGHHYNI